MKRIIVFAAVVAVIALAAWTVPALAQGPTGGWMMGMGGRSGMGGWVPGQAVTSTVPYGPGMMGGWLPGQTITPTVPFGYGPGMMGGWVPGQAVTPTMPYGYGPGMMGGRGGMMGGRGMMGGYGSGYAPNTQPIVLDQAVTKAQQYVAGYNNADLKLAEIEEYAWNFYGVVKEKSTGANAFQILVDKYSGTVYPEMGPNMMWNTKYSPMAGFGSTQPSGKMTVTIDQARSNAAQYLKTNLPNTTVEDKGDAFYGYYNFDILQNGKTYGMLSVNGYTGAVWFHAWHGDFVAAKTLE
jgi:hypothetical protein